MFERDASVDGSRRDDGASALLGRCGGDCTQKEQAASLARLRNVDCKEQEKEEGGPLTQAFVYGISLRRHDLL